MQNTIINLVEQIVMALGTEFKIYLPQIIPQILKVFMQDTSDNRAVTGKVSTWSLSYIVRFTCDTNTGYCQLPVVILCVGYLCDLLVVILCVIYMYMYLW